MFSREIKPLRFASDAVEWIKENAGTLDSYEVSLIKSMLQFERGKITQARIKSVYFTATHEDEIEQVVYQCNRIN